MRYLYIDDHDLKTEDLLALSPYVMAWSDHVWLIDLRPCLNYWHHRATHLGLDLASLLTDLLNRLSQHKRFKACAAHHPWQAMVLGRLLSQKGLQGLVDQKNHFARSIYQQLSWDLWWQLIDEFEAHSSVSTSIFQGMTRADLNRFSKHRSAMKKAMARLKLHSPHDLSSFDQPGLRRRFGTTLATIIAWTFCDEQASVGLFCDEQVEGFPFIAFVNQEPLTVERHLDVALDHWEHLEALLMQDANKLCELMPHESDLILSLEWRILLHDLRCIDVRISFRYPHDIHRDSPSHKTILLQAHYSFLAAKAEVDREYAEIEAVAPPVIGWQLIVRGTLPKHHMMLDWFDDQMGELGELGRLENLIPLPLQQYTLTQDWCPESSFVLSDLSSASKSESSSASILALCAKRPAFIFSRPELLMDHSDKAQSSSKRFLERTMDRWWMIGCNQQRDYYLRADAINGKQWVYQDSKGQWFRHGIFG